MEFKSKATLLKFPSFPQFFRLGESHGAISGNPVFSLVSWIPAGVYPVFLHGAGMTDYETLLMNSLVTDFKVFKVCFVESTVS